MLNVGSQIFPFEPNDSPENKAVNRRLELNFMPKRVAFAEVLEALAALHRRNTSPRGPTCVRWWHVKKLVTWRFSRLRIVVLLGRLLAPSCGGCPRAGVG